MSLLTENIWAQEKEIGTIFNKKYKLTGHFLKASIVTQLKFPTHGEFNVG